MHHYLHTAELMIFTLHIAHVALGSVIMHENGISMPMQVGRRSYS